MHWVPFEIGSEVNNTKRENERKSHYHEDYVEKNAANGLIDRRLVQNELG